MREVVLTESNSGELVTQDPYHRHSGLIGVMAVITRRSRFGLLVLKSDEKMCGRRDNLDTRHPFVDSNPGWRLGRPPS